MGRKITFGFRMYYEEEKDRRGFFPKVKPFFELYINGEK
jgi:hypothetical protein